MSSTFNSVHSCRVFRCNNNINLPKLGINPTQPDSKLLNNSFSDINTNINLKSEKLQGLIRPL